MRQQGQGARLVLRVAEQQLAESRLEAQPGKMGRTLDDLAEPGAGQGGDEVQAGLGQSRQVVVVTQRRDVVGADREDDGCRRRGVSDELPSQSRRAAASEPV